MQSFHNKKSIKNKYVKRLESHYKQDEIIKGTYWEGGKGCAVGCTVHSNLHQCYEIELGLPEWLARLEDALFEGMSNEQAKEFPLKFLKSIPIGITDEQFQSIHHKLCVFILEKICKYTDDKLVEKAISDIIILHRQESKDEAAWSAARSAAESAAWSAAEYAAESAAWSAWSAAEYAAESAAWSAWSAAGSAGSARSAAWSAGSARSAAWSARSAAWSARSAGSAGSAGSARSAAWSAAGSAKSAAYYQISEELIRLLMLSNETQENKKRIGEEC